MSAANGVNGHHHNPDPPEPDLTPLREVIADIVGSHLANDGGWGPSSLDVADRIADALSVDRDVPLAAFQGQMAIGAAFSIVEHLDPTLDIDPIARRTAGPTRNCWVQSATSGEVELYAGRLLDLVVSTAQAMVATLPRRERST